MSITRTIGKNTLGDNDKMQVHMREYEMSNHDLSFVWRNTQSPGTLVPFMKIVAQKGDIFDINLTNKTLTHPTVGPLFGAYKLQHFVFTCPIRLYNSWLHNNRAGIGLDMSQIKFPTMNVSAQRYQLSETVGKWLENSYPIHPSSLLAYLGYKRPIRNNAATPLKTYITYNAMPVLMYWDIVKNYFANTQENRIAYLNQEATISSWAIQPITSGVVITRPNGMTFTETPIFKNGTVTPSNNPGVTSWSDFWNSTTITYKKLNDSKIYEEPIGNLATNIGTNKITLDKITEGEQIYVTKIETEAGFAIDIAYVSLETIDNMRDTILATKGNTSLLINSSSADIFWKGLQENANREQAGLALKTYDSDLFNNWINTDWIEGENGINEISAAAIVDGKLTMDSLNLAQKVYNMLNRIAISGGTYRDWLETVYTTGKYIDRPETPIFEGGMTQYIEFEEVISNSASEGQPLGTLAGRGKNMRQAGSGKLHFKVSEPSYIIGLCAITPMVDYGQGIDWDVVELKTMDDLHKPALDGIGYEDSLNYQRTVESLWLDDTTGEPIITSPGKTVAWINYMTNYNRTFGNFASGMPEEFMVLNRNYEWDETTKGTIDTTTYIDPQKHNDIFADTSISAMNFWLQTACDIKVRRNISAKQIPNL